jgi:hypothetical protein
VVALAACSDDPDSAGAAALVSPEPIALASRHLASGRVESVMPLTRETDLPEGIALNRQGDIFVGNRRLNGDQRVSEILRITPDNSVSVFARLVLSTLDFDRGVLGLAVDGDGDLYAAFASGVPATHGVWRIGRRGGRARLAGSAAMVIPNALAFDARGNLYVTDSRDAGREGRSAHRDDHPIHRRAGPVRLPDQPRLRQGPARSQEHLRRERRAVPGEPAGGGAEHRARGRRRAGGSDPPVMLEAIE